MYKIVGDIEPRSFWLVTTPSASQRTMPYLCTEAGTLYALGTPFVSPFIGGGLVTSLWPLLIERLGSLGFGLVACAISVAIICVMRVFFWNAHPQMQQR